MSDLRVALVAEGPTDAVIVEAVLKALISRDFVLTTLQPEPTRPSAGSGWGGVLRWCENFSSRGFSSIEDDPLLSGFDLYVLHLDADVANASYLDVSGQAENSAQIHSWPRLPAAVVCPPVEDGVEVVRNCLISWLNVAGPSAKTVFCVPSKAIDAWLATAVLGHGHGLIAGIECNLNIARQLAVLPIGSRVKKSIRDYRACQAKVSNEWGRVRQICLQAERFSADVENVFSTRS